MVINKAAHDAPWARTLARAVAQPVFPHLPGTLRPYLLALLLFAGAGALASAGDAALLRYGLSWPLVALLIVAAAASLWGVRPALLVMSLSAVYGVGAAVRLQVPIFHLHLTWQGMLIRTLLFAACGAAAIRLVDRARIM